MKKRVTWDYWVEAQVIGGWQSIDGSYGNRSYAMGWYDSMRFDYSDLAMRLVRTHSGDDDTLEVVKP